MLQHTKAHEEEDTSGKDMEEEPRRWDEMQADCLVSIFRRLALDDLTVAVPFVCKSWWRASLDPSCWRRLDFRSLDLKPRSHFCRRFTSQYRLKTVPFSCFMRLAIHRSRGSAEDFAFPLSLAAPSIQDIDFVSIKCPGLKSLALPDNLMLEDVLDIPELVGRWRDLEQLEMYQMPFSFVEIIAEIGRNCARFTGLKVGGLIRKKDAEAIARWLPELKHLEVRKSHLTNDVLVVIINGCRKLESLTVENVLGIRARFEVLELVSLIKRFEYKEVRGLPDFCSSLFYSLVDGTGTFFW